MDFKKPNITEGNWKVMEEEAGVPYIRVRGTELGCKYKICNVNVPFINYLSELHDKDLNESRANAKAISAVPDMIDALIDFVHLRKEECDSWGIELEDDKIYSKGLKALKKAGCADDS